MIRTSFRAIPTLHRVDALPFDPSLLHVTGTRRVPAPSRLAQRDVAKTFILQVVETFDSWRRAKFQARLLLGRRALTESRLADLKETAQQTDKNSVPDFAYFLKPAERD
jgi:hypothetical protein